MQTLITGVAALLAISAAMAMPAHASDEQDHPVRAADPVYADTLALDEVSVTSIKQGTAVDQQPVASTTVREPEIRRLNIVTMKDVSAIAPNFYIPSYGSRMTSSVYVRGIGARIDQPVVGLNVDNMPFLNKDNYDFDLTDIERIEVLRGPQSTLYGRNTMGGQVNIYTLSPMRWQGWRLLADAATGPSGHVAAGWYHKMSSRLAMSVSANMGADRGNFTNGYNGRPVGSERNAALRWKTVARPAAGWSLENIAALQWGDQSGYPYAYEPTGEISYNDTTSYRRTSLSDGLTVRWTGSRVSVSSITSVQLLDDRMTLDQDFLPLDYFTLVQDRREWALTQDFVARGSVGGHYSWIGGLFGFIRHTRMNAPVTFKNYGITHLIEDKLNDVNPDYPVRWDDREFVLGSDFTYPVRGAALYHQSSWTAGDFTVTGGLRLDYEHASLDYRSETHTSYTIERRMPDGTLEPFSHHRIDIDDGGRLSRSFVQLLPKVSLTWRIPSKRNSDVFVSVAKGYKSGGFNTQMFSDVLQQRIMNLFGVGMTYDTDDIVSYKPEKSWNYEAGAHFECAGGKVLSDVAVFYIDCRDQQMTMFPDGTTTGRITTNAGRTRSAGAEIAVKYRPVREWLINLSYGFTDARFVRFDNGRTDYAGKRVPYAPRNTLFAGLTWSRTMPNRWIDGVEISANVRGIGSVCWDEENTSRQPFYALPGLSATVTHGVVSLKLWCDNVTDTRYDVFSFMSVGNRFVQRGTPREAGLTVRVTVGG